MNNTSYTLAPRNFTKSIRLMHHIPNSVLSSKAIGWSLSSDPANVAEAPTVKLNEKKSELIMNFETDTTGLCAA